MSKIREKVIQILCAAHGLGLTEIRDLPFIIESELQSIPNYRVSPEHFKTLEDSKELLREMGMQGELTPAQYETTKRFIDLMASFSVCSSPEATWSEPA